MDKDGIRVIIGAIAIGLFYFLPTLVSLKHRQQFAIFLLNLLLGWTVLGWIIALIWAATKPAKH